jgi:hypothetical protein
MLLLALVAMPSAAFAAASKVPIVLAILTPDSPLQEGEYLWEPERAPTGKLEIVADVARDTLYVYRGGVEIGRTILIYGADEKPTPLGSFPILQKKVHHISNLYNARCRI